MGCIGCTVSTNGESPKGCKSNGNCSSGGCNRLNTYDWISSLDISDPDEFNIIEVSFKNGARKNFFRSNPSVSTVTGDMVVVETGNGYDVGTITLSGELVRLQMKKKRVEEDAILHSLIRVANDRDLEKLQEARSLERGTMIRSRVIARTLGLEMKIGDVEYQGDKRKATFYYTADGRVDFRELIRHYAKEFRVKIEMRQIGARQESARIGGVGSCGRELCCSTWLTDFKSVSTTAARYQNLAINQTKLSGQCGRLKCCLNYELDTYLDALEHFPQNAEKLFTEVGTANLIKTDIFKGLMYYAYDHEHGRGKIHALELKRVHAIQEMNENGEKPTDLVDLISLMDSDEVQEVDFADVTGVIELPPEERKKRKSRRRNRNKKKGQGGKPSNPSANKNTRSNNPNNKKNRPPQNRNKNNRKNK